MSCRCLPPGSWQRLKKQVFRSEIFSLEFMAKVTLTGNLRLYTAGITEVEIEASNIRELLKNLGREYPDLVTQLTDDLAVAIDGKIYQDDWFAPIGPDSEVHLMPRIGGG